MHFFLITTIQEDKTDELRHFLAKTESVAGSYQLKQINILFKFFLKSGDEYSV